MPKRIDLTGRRFGHLTVLRLSHSDGRRLHWWCYCDNCGQERAVTSDNLLRKNTPARSCGCLRGHWKPRGEAAAHHMYTGYRRSAAQRGLAFELDEGTFRSLTQQPCAYCGAAPATVRTKKYRRQKLNGTSVALNGTYIANGIDRLDNSQGYLTGNIVPCCPTCNDMKGTLPAEQFIAACRAIAEHSVGNLHWYTRTALRREPVPTGAAAAAR